MVGSLKNALLSTVLFSLLAQGAPQRKCGGAVQKVGKAIYLLTNDANNAVVALPIGADGTLCKGTVTGTGGAGSNSIDGTTNTPAGPDALIGQSALAVVGQSLFAVNAGSNTLSMMSIDPADPTKLTPVGQSVAIPGEFPNTVAASAKNKLACVGSTGAKAGISCSNFSKANGLSAMDGLRPFDLNQTTPPVGPTNSVSQAFFSADESRLFTTVKGDPTVNNTGFLSVFPVQQGCGAGGSQPASLSTTDVRSSPPGTAVLFGSEVIPGTSNIFATDASFGAAVLALDDKTNQASVVGKQAIGDQKATCWTAISKATQSAFVSDVGVNHIVEMSLTDAKIIATIDTSANNPGPGFIDLKAAGGFVYALSPGNGTSEAQVVVMDVSGGQGTAKVIQSFGLGAMGVDKNAQGMQALL